MQSSSPREWFVIAALSATCAGVAIFAVYAPAPTPAVPPTDAKELTRGDAAPIDDLDTLAGDPANLEDQIGHQWVVMNFWATWCDTCHTNRGTFVEAAETFPEIAFVGVLHNDNAARARQYLDRERHHWKNRPLSFNRNGSHLDDTDGELAHQYGVSGVPETFLIDPSGRIHSKWTGPIEVRQIADALPRP